MKNSTYLQHVTVRTEEVEERLHVIFFGFSPVTVMNVPEQSGTLMTAFRENEYIKCVQQMIRTYHTR
jgi:hypothetical protein